MIRQGDTGFRRTGRCRAEEYAAHPENRDRRQDRTFLPEGLPVQLTCNAFPYQRHGIVKGTPQTIAPVARLSAQTRQPVYEGRIALGRDHCTVRDTSCPLRYGMTASGEIVVRQRRRIDLRAIRSASSAADGACSGATGQRHDACARPCATAV
jgi:hypothetical protein